MGNGLKDALAFLLPSSTLGVPIQPRDDDDYIDIGEFIVEPTNRLWEPKCTCGCDKVYGPKNNLHSEWCDKITRWKK